ncbi:MAG: NADH-quinone oxidoreductase subunit N [Candidatus Methylomirabilota bacterium]|nr:NADH-quinone oxidoreductase subunit N [candidate division NC10 bacterium]PWB48592.1 MAG: NADH-quinone oxidoreductase subunit N [candidate division NC10 bacterium]
MTELVLPQIDWTVFAPLIPVAVGGFATLMIDLFPSSGRKQVAAILSVIALAVSIVLSIRSWGTIGYGVHDAVVLDRFTLFFYLVLGLIGILTILLSMGHLGTATADQGEYYSLILFSVLGMMLMAAGGDLIVMFLGLETFSLALYILAGFWKTELRSNESALKYLLLGAFAGGFFLYGIALIYGATGTTVLRQIMAFLADGDPPSPLFWIGGGLLLIGFGFKIASVPFHMWVPDVYEGAPTSVTAFMIAGTKAAAFAAFLRVFLLALPALHVRWSVVIWVLAVLTMTIGNLVALAQSNIKRMLAYSSIAHAGYLLVALVAGGSSGVAGILFYLVVYALMNLGVFAVIIAVQHHKRERLLLSDYAGLGWQRPFLAACMAVFMFSLSGIPPTAGFMGKLYIFSAALEGHYPGLAVIGVLNSVVSVYYYLRVVVIMYMSETASPSPLVAAPAAAVLAVLVSVLGTLHLGLFPASLLDLARQSVSAIVG